MTEANMRSQVAHLTAGLGAIRAREGRLPAVDPVVVSEMTLFPEFFLTHGALVLGERHDGLDVPELFERNIFCHRVGLGSRRGKEYLMFKGSERCWGIER